MNRSKARGDRWERDCARHLIACGFTGGARMLRTGAHVDHGDLFGVDGVVIDCKDAQRHELSVWLDEVVVEAAALNLQGALVVKRARRSTDDSYVVQRFGDWLDTRRQLADALARLADMEGEST